jgi:hypothetical protein
VAEVEVVALSRAERPEAAVLLQQAAVLRQVGEAQALSSAVCVAEVGREAPRLAAAKISVFEVPAVPAEELDAVVAEVRQRAAAHAAGLRPAAECAAVAREAAGVLAVAAAPLQVAVAELDEAVPRLAAVRVEAAEEAVVRRRAALGGEAARRGAVAWVFRLDRLLPWLGP